MSNDTTNSKKTAVPAYVSFCHELAARAAALGLELETAPTETGLPQNKGFAFVRAKGSTAAFIVPKAVAGVKAVESHIELPDSEPVLNNGRVVCRIAPALLTDDCLVRLLGASKRPVVQPARKAKAQDSGTTQGTTPSLSDEEATALLTAGL
jgi:hypothetical protein